jgi:hypothetical protein
MQTKSKMKLKNSQISPFLLSLIMVLLSSCAAIKKGESWNMLPENKTIGLTLLWELPEEKIREMLPADQIPRIRNGNGVLMLFLASTEAYAVGEKKYGQLGVAHLIIPLQNSISIPETIGLKTQPIISGLKQVGFPVKFGEVSLFLHEMGDSVKVVGSIDFENGKLSFSGSAENKKGALVNLPETTLLGKNSTKNILSGPEFYRPIAFQAISVEQEGENWMTQHKLDLPPNRVWVNVDFGIDFKLYKNIPVRFKP